MFIYNIKILQIHFMSYLNSKLFLVSFYFKNQIKWSKHIVKNILLNITMSLTEIWCKISTLLNVIPLGSFSWGGRLTLLTYSLNKNGLSTFITAASQKGTSFAVLGWYAGCSALLKIARIWISGPFLKLMLCKPAIIL